MLEQMDATSRLLLALGSAGALVTIVLGIQAFRNRDRRKISRRRKERRKIKTHDLPPEGLERRLASRRQSERRDLEQEG